MKQLDRLGHYTVVIRTVLIPMGGLSPVHEGIECGRMDILRDDKSLPASGKCVVYLGDIYVVVIRLPRSIEPVEREPLRICFRLLLGAAVLDEDNRIFRGVSEHRFPLLLASLEDIFVRKVSRGLLVAVAIMD